VASPPHVETSVHDPSAPAVGDAPRGIRAARQPLARVSLGDALTGIRMSTLCSQCERGMYST